MTGENERYVPLTTGQLLHYLQCRGVIDTAEAQVTPLSGGVSGTVYLVKTATSSIVVKQAQPQLDVPGIWLADPARAQTEADALNVFAKITPQNVPRVIDDDASTFTFVMEAAPTHWREWRRALLQPVLPESELRPESIATLLGSVLGRWHIATWGDSELALRFAKDQDFAQLRIHPYFDDIRMKYPDISPKISEMISDLTTRRQCLIHGDFSPKNVLAGADGLWVVDCEVACFANPLFDVAFLAAHLMLIALHNPAAETSLRKSTMAFLASYRSTTADSIPLHDLPRFVLPLLLARVDGRSRVTYLTEAEEGQVRRTALGGIRRGVDLHSMWPFAPSRPFARWR